MRRQSLQRCACDGFRFFGIARLGGAYFTGLGSEAAAAAAAGSAEAAADASASIAVRTNFEPYIACDVWLIERRSAVSD